MIKQRYIRHEAINKDGQVVGTGFEVGGQIYDFNFKVEAIDIRTTSTSQFMRWYGEGVGLQHWKDFVNSGKNCRFRKAIVFVG